jgi:transcription antitermination factor NusG
MPGNFSCISSSSVFWHAVYTRHQHEKQVAAGLSANGFNVFLPTYNVVRCWSDRTRQLSLPLFPCYIFVQSTFDGYLRILTTPGVHSIVMFNSQPAVIPETEIAGIRRVVNSRYKVEPHPFLEYGDWVRIKSGPLADLEGIFVRSKSSHRLILTAELLGKSISVEIDAFNVLPLHRRSVASNAPPPFHSLAGSTKETV